MIVYSCVFGNTDPLHEPEVTGNARFICFTDQPITSSVWEMINVPTQEAPTRTARMAKALSHHLFPREEWVLWMDANFTLQADPESLIHHGEFVNFVHADRRRITDEAVEIVKLGKAKERCIKRQLATYHGDGFDTAENLQQQLSCNGVILRRHTDDVKALNDSWAGELAYHTLRDQMSLDYTAWRHGLTLSKWPGSHRDNPYFRHKHYKRPTNDF